MISKWLKRLESFGVSQRDFSRLSSISVPILRTYWRGNGASKPATELMLLVAIKMACHRIAAQAREAALIAEEVQAELDRRGEHGNA